MDWNTLDLDRVVNALLLFIAGLLGILGYGQARKKVAAPETEQMQVAGAIIDRKDVDRMVTTFDRLTAAIVALTAMMPDHKKSLDQSSEAVDEMREAVKDIGRDLQDVTRELIRRSAH